MTMTEREFLTQVIDICDDETIKEYAQAKIQKMDEKNKNRKGVPTKKQRENETLKNKILEMFQQNPDTVFVASEIATQFEISTQKATPLCKQLVYDGKIIMTDVKIVGQGTRKSYQFKK